MTSVGSAFSRPPKALRLFRDMFRDRLRSDQVLPWRLSYLGGPLNTLVGVHLRRPLLQRWIRRVTECLPDEVTVIIAHRNRADYRIRNAIQSIQQQICRARIRILVVDYGSEPEQSARLLAITNSLGVDCLPVRGPGRWNKSHCLNIGIKQVHTKFVMISDVDVMLAPNYLAEAMAALHRDPLTAVFAPCVYLPASCGEYLKAAAESGERLDLEALRLLGSLQNGDQVSHGMVATYTRYFHEIGGYDEFYHTYGTEDSDLAKRFLNLGLRNVSIAPRSFYLHQWHLKYEGVFSDSLHHTIQRNVAYCRRTHSIRRNPGDWGNRSTDRLMTLRASSDHI